MQVSETLALSFCNTAGNSSPLAVVFAPHQPRKVLTHPHYKSGCGIGFFGSYLYLACSTSDQASGILIFEAQTLNLVEHIPLPTIKDIHSVYLDGPATLIAASTGTDEIVRVILTSHGRHETLWRASHQSADTNHVNSVTRHNGRLIASAFGYRTAQRWYTARNGYVVDIETGERKMANLYHPHSLVSRRGIIHMCESSAMRVLDGNGDAIIMNSGYIRGLAFGSEGTVYVGASRGRMQSMLSGETLNPADPGVPVGRCGLFIIEPLRQEKTFLDLTELAIEIYDVAVLP